jgi:hypothetical protein
MAEPKPYHRMRRGIKDGLNSRYSSWAYIKHKAYAKEPTHFIRAYLIIQNDLEKLFEFVEPSDESLRTYSYRIDELCTAARF